MKVQIYNWAGNRDVTQILTRLELEHDKEYEWSEVGLRRHTFALFRNGLDTMLSHRDDGAVLLSVDNRRFRQR